jgi:pyrroline-5-carboxylate reductase
LGCQVAELSSAIPADAAPDLIVIAVKPQVIAQTLVDYKRFGGGGTTFLSVAAGVTIAAFSGILGKQTPIVRCMPNMPAAIGKGMIVVCSNPWVSDTMELFISDLLSLNGKVAAIADEDLLDAVTAVSGSGPAYLFHFIEALTTAGKKAGLPADLAKLLAVQTTYGAASLAAESDEHPGTLRRQVTSPNGTTAAALDILLGNGRLESLLVEAVEAARQRSIQLRSGEAMAELHKP